jgi:hypothetical protein
MRIQSFEEWDELLRPLMRFFRKFKTQPFHDWGERREEVVGAKGAQVRGR